jgi:hypothetical protein
MFRLGEKKERPFAGRHRHHVRQAYRLPRNTMAIDRIVVDARKPTEARAKEGWGESPTDVVSMLMLG